MRKAIKIDLKAINTMFNNFNQAGLYERIDLVRQELGYKSMFAFAGGDRLLYNVIDRKAYPNFKTIYAIWEICKLNGKDLDLNWFLLGIKNKHIIEENDPTSVLEEIRIKHLEEANKSLLAQVEMQAKLIDLLEQKIATNG